MLHGKTALGMAFSMKVKGGWGLGVRNGVGSFPAFNFLKGSLGEEGERLYLDTPTRISK